jgi:hypothetical protein
MRQIPGGGRLRLRVVTSRGRKYRQAVVYRWNTTKRRGETIVIGHLGPVTPRRSQVDKRRIYWALAALKRAKARRLMGKATRLATTARRELTRSARRSLHRRIDRNSVVRSQQARTLQDRVLREVEHVPEGLTRAELASRLVDLKVQIPGGAHGLTTSDHLGMALTVLHQWGRLRRRGHGGRGDPYVYSVPRDATVEPSPSSPDGAP